VMPGLMKGVRWSRTSAARRQAVRISWMPGSSLMVMLMAAIIPEGNEACAAGRMPGSSRPSQRPEGHSPDRFQTVSLHITEFEGGQALSGFRIQQLLPRLQAVHPKIAGIAARYVHLVAADHAPAGPERERLAALLTYGEPYTGGSVGPLLVVTPRFGTLS